ncbi:carboxypeptidase-like regulatory domain-containing protein [Flavobacterium sp. CBA20B-1]|uniref:Carboxypeptidase-like regulatory domain-containing protein n=1 Tax=Paenimyroides aestuarii TaxID=2968490 RepID=A0ABY5NS06_9FLAO|nr:MULTISPECIES: carboxypeptidase-like regulatory domain-containing protein [Flavobacteriaceae]UUV21353.1 carboxypeptidase-like regulatory domain-containing protein [Paenimyroides aestuarii]WCM42024.1 carboxypeptidase-like regulatory domain-containing protein [Flavobacterium sp. CBA20B-1]
MRYFAVLFFLLLSITIVAQEKNIQGIVFSELSYQPESHASIVNLNSLKVAQTNPDGSFSILAQVNDTLHVSSEGFRSLKIKVTNDWYKEGKMNIYIKDLSTVLDEVVINTLKLTGILAVDAKLIALADYPYYRDFGPTGFAANYNRGLNPINGIYNAIKRNSSETKKINQIRKEVELIELMKKKYDREMVSALLNISKEDIVKVLQRCNQSERFIYTANDYQIFNAVNECYENYKLGK